MLRELSIKNVAVIENISVSFESGMNVLTGETGAGKSIIVDSINMILGERASKEIVRFNEKKAVVQALFSVNDQVTKKCEEIGCDIDDELIITREITSDGKSTARINGMIVTLNNLKELGSMLINIHGQHDNQSLLTPKCHINFLDEYAQNSSLLLEYKNCFENLKSIKNKLEKLQINEAEKLKRIDLLKFEINEINAANLVVGEADELSEQKELIKNSEKISINISQATNDLYEDEDGNSAYDKISSALSSLEQISELSEDIKDACSSLYDVQSIVSDVAHAVREFGENVEYDENELNDIIERLDLINKLKRKYGNDISYILEYCQKNQEELDNIEHIDENADKLRKELDECKKQLLYLAKKLTLSRNKNAKEIEEKINVSLSELNMEHSRFSISINTDDSHFQSDGIDTVEFLIKTNSKEPLKPLVKIASGGELSRIMLALKSTLSDNVETLIFDEIDTGVSGNAAQKIANKLNTISKEKQILCISHLPQLASMADHHFLIEKSFDNDIAKTNVSELFDDKRVNEIARITGGELTDLSISHAKEMLEQANKYKQKNI